MGNLKQACSESEHHEGSLDVPTEKSVKMSELLCTELNIMKGDGGKRWKAKKSEFLQTMIAKEGENEHKCLIELHGEIRIMSK